jgi:hypothetical protein
MSFDFYHITLGIGRGVIKVFMTEMIKYNLDFIYLMKSQLIAPCGINCGICYAFLREKNYCSGCRGSDEGKAVSILRCKIRTCDKRSKFCDCSDIPCDKLKHLDKRYRNRYHISMIENLSKIKEKGVREFVKGEESRWKCPDCRGVICVHKGYCLGCWKKK